MSRKRRVPAISSEYSGLRRPDALGVATSRVHQPPRDRSQCADPEDDDGERLNAQLTRDEADQLELQPGDIVYVRTRREKTFSA